MNTIYPTTTSARVTDDNPLVKMESLAQGSQRILLEIKSVFPFDLFPDEVIIDETKVSIHRNYFFYTGQIQSVELKDVFNVVVNHGLFFAKLELFDRYFAQQPISVEYLKKEDAIRARHIIQGLVIAKKENIDITALSEDDLIAKLDRIGQSR